MDSFLNQVEKLSQLAAREKEIAIAPLDVASVMARVERAAWIVPACERETQRLMAGFGILITAAAAVVLFFAIPIVNEKNNPVWAMDSLMDVMESSEMLLESFDLE